MTNAIEAGPAAPKPDVEKVAQRSQQAQREFTSRWLRGLDPRTEPAIRFCPLRNDRDD